MVTRHEKLLLLRNQAAEDHFNSLIENDVITRRENKRKRKIWSKWLSQSQPLLTNLLSLESNPVDTWWRVFRRTAYELPGGQRATMKDLSYVSGEYSQEAFDEGQKTWDEDKFWKDVGHVADQKVLEKCI